MPAANSDHPLSFSDPAQAKQAYETLAVRNKEAEDWLYAIWMAFLASNETELDMVLRNFSAWMFKQEEEAS